MPSTMHAPSTGLIDISSNVAGASDPLLSESIGSPMGLVEPREDRFWLFDTRGISSAVCSADLRSPRIRVRRLDRCGRSTASSIEQFYESICQSPRVAFYVHGNRMPAKTVVSRGMTVYHRTKRYQTPNGMDWVIWSWPSERQGLLAKDVRIKAARCDAQGLYLAHVLRHPCFRQTPVAAVGFSFGARVITGALHATAGGSLGGRCLPGPPAEGLGVDVGLIAAAIENHWLMPGRYHGLATRNMHQLTLLYNRRDAVLKRYWLIDRMRGQSALGFTGPLSFGPRVDGSRLPVSSRDCATVVGLQHSEVDYYQDQCRAGRQMATLLRDVHPGMP